MRNTVRNNVKVDQSSVAFLTPSRRRVNRKADDILRDCNAARLDTARRAMAAAVVYAAKDRKEFSVREVLDYTGLNEFDLKALGTLLIDACNAGVLRSSNDGLWQVLDRDMLGAVVYRGSN